MSESAISVISMNHRGDDGNKFRAINQLAAASGPVFGDSARGVGIGCALATGGCRVVVRDRRGLEPSSTGRKHQARWRDEASRSCVTVPVIVRAVRARSIASMSVTEA